MAERDIRSKTRWLPAVFLLALAALYWHLMRPEIAGVFYDDGVYLLGAKAMATGHGYVLLSEIGQPAIIKYPPLFSLVLAPIWKFHPDFPDNLVCFKGLNILFSLLVLYGFHRLGHRAFRLSALETALFSLWLGLNFYWVNLTVEVFSEPLYLLFVTMVLGWSLKLDAGNEQKLSHRNLAGLIALSVLAFYTRTAGLALMAGLLAWLWRRFGRQRALTYLLGCLLACAGWVWWVANHPPRVELVGDFYSLPYNMGYLDELTYHIIGQRGVVPVLGTSAAVFPLAIVRTILPASVDWTRGWDRFLAEACYPAGNLVMLLLVVVGMGLLVRQAWRLGHPLLWYAAFYLPLVFLWPAHDQYPRLLMGVLPFLGLAAFGAIRQSCSKRSYYRPAVIGLLAVLCLMNLSALRGLPRDSQLVAGSTGDLLWRDMRAAFKAIGALPATATVWGRYNGMYPLYTGRQVINRNLVAAPVAYPRGNSLAENEKIMQAAVLEYLHKARIDFLLLEPRIQGYQLRELPDAAAYRLIQAYPDVFQPIYESPNGLAVLFRVRHTEAASGR